jgi:hypothetical protein
MLFEVQIGWLGTAFIVMSYLLISSGHSHARDPKYLLLILAGSTSIIYGSLSLGAAQPIVFNSFFFTFAVLALIGMKLPKIKGGLTLLMISAIVAGAVQWFSTLHLIGALGTASVVLFVFGFLLFTQGLIKEKYFYINNLTANFLYVGVLIETNNWSSVGIVAVTTAAAIYGLMRVFYDNNSDFCMT